jgi:hypothetical protein
LIERPGDHGTDLPIRVTSPIHDSDQNMRTERAATAPFALGAHNHAPMRTE